MTARDDLSAWLADTDWIGEATDDFTVGPDAMRADGTDRGGHGGFRLWTQGPTTTATDRAWFVFAEASERLSIAAANYTSAMLRFNQVMSLTGDQMATFVRTLRGEPGTSVIVDEEEEEESGLTLAEAEATEPRSFTFTERAPWEPPPVWYKPATTLQRLKAGVSIEPPIRARIVVSDDATPNRTERRHGTKCAIVPPSGS